MLNVEIATTEMSNANEELASVENTETLVKATNRLSENDGGCSASQQEVINEPEPISVHTVSNSLESQEKASPEIARRVSRTEAVKQDAMKLKTATLDRMSRMFKQRAKASNEDKAADGTTNGDSELDLATRKQKTNSLGRMFKLVDKDGSPKKLFVPPRSGSLSRILRRHPPETDNSPSKKNSCESTPGMFSRMLNQLRGRPHSGSKPEEGSPRVRGKTTSLPPKVPSASRTPPHLPSSPSSPITSPSKQTVPAERAGC